jgi:hypothetical protein
MFIYTVVILSKSMCGSNRGHFNKLLQIVFHVHLFWHSLIIRHYWNLTTGVTQRMSGVMQELLTLPDNTCDEV